MQVARIDHVHIEVADRDVAADWYGRVLGLRRDPELEFWADDPMGPLILVGGDGFPTLSLFARRCAEPSRDATVAFRIDGESFLSFCRDVERLGLADADGAKLSNGAMVDHQKSWSVYFCDPDRNRIELTTYDYVLVANAA